MTGASELSYCDRSDWSVFRLRHTAAAAFPGRCGGVAAMILKAYR